MTQNDGQIEPKWPKMTKNDGPKWLWNDPKWPKMMAKMTQNDPTWPKNDPTWPKMIQNGQK